MSPARKSRPRPKLPWWLLPLGIGLGVAALWALLTASPPGDGRSDPGTPPSGEIGDDSRAALRQILREAGSGEPEEGAR